MKPFHHIENEKPPDYNDSEKISCKSNCIGTLCHRNLTEKNNNRIINPRSVNAKGRIRKSVAVTAV